VFGCLPRLPLAHGNRLSTVIRNAALKTLLEFAAAKNAASCREEKGKKMSRYFNCESDTAYRDGRRDEERGRTDYEYDRHSDRERDRAYFEGHRDQAREDARRREDLRQEEAREERHHREVVEWQRQKQYEQEQQWYQQQEEQREQEQQQEEAHPCAEMPPQDTAEAGSTCV